MFRWFIDRFNDTSVRKKLFLIYLLGIFLPLFTANSFFIANILDYTKKSEMEFTKSSIESLASSLENEFLSILSVSQLIYADAGIYAFLNREINSMKEYYPLHHDYLNPTLKKYISVFSNIKKITIYTDNPAFQISSGYLYLNEYNRNSLWFQRLQENRALPILMWHSDFDRRQYIVNQEILSLFRLMDNTAMTRKYPQMIQRIDMETTSLKDHMSELNYQGFMELVDPWGTIAIRTEKGNPAGNSYSFIQKISQNDEFSQWTLRGEIVLSSYQVDTVFRVRSFLLISALSLLIASLFIFGLSYSLSKRLHILSSHLRKVEQQDFSPIHLIQESADEIGLLIKDFNIMAGRIDYLINEVFRVDLEREKLMVSRHKTQLNVLQSQIDPHFLNNVLESIRMKSLIKGEKETADIVKKLGRLFSRITYWQEDMITIKEELSFVREYLEIQKYRFEDKLSYSLDCDPALGHFLIPKITIQGLVENACIHGIENKAEPGKIVILVTSGTRGLCIRVEDDGIGMDKDVMAANQRGNHSGLRNIRERLEMHYGENAVMVIDSLPMKGTLVTLHLPIKELDLV